MAKITTDNYVRSYMELNDCTFEEAWAATNADPKCEMTHTIPKGPEYEVLIDKSFHKYRDIYKKRNIDFYKLLAPNHEVIVSCILRGKDLYYDIPKRYQMNSAHPFVLNWLLMYSRPEVLSKVRTIGPAKLHTIYKALDTWISEHPEDTVFWIYRKEWDRYFNNSESGKEEKPKTEKMDKVASVMAKALNAINPKKEEETPMAEMKDILPELEFFEKKGAGTGRSYNDVRIYLKRFGNLDHLYISFRSDTADRFASSYVNIAVLNNRLYFKETEERNGYKISKKNKGNCKTGSMQMSVNGAELAKISPFLEKEYNFKFDEGYGLYYVELED